MASSLVAHTSYRRWVMKRSPRHERMSQAEKEILVFLKLVTIVSHDKRLHSSPSPNGQENSYASLDCFESSNAPLRLHSRACRHCFVRLQEERRNLTPRPRGIGHPSASTSHRRRTAQQSDQPLWYHRTRSRPAQRTGRARRTPLS